MSLAVRYRPKEFSEVVGQENIVRILQNQIESSDLRHAYLFVGGAGTGKTTLARIFANKINSEVTEIDAASNNGVDDIRDIRESCKYKPITAEYKVFLIDEVHMLSTAAFNALLKTLEEPPEHVIFIMCTTDPHKIPSTVLSRCQKFEFKRIPYHQVVRRLSEIIENENKLLIAKNKDSDCYSYTDDVLDIIAKHADGGMRDAITLLDTCLGYSGVITPESIYDIVGTSSFDETLDMLEHMINSDVRSILELVESIHYAGKDLKQFIKQLMELSVELGKLALFNDINKTVIPAIYYERSNNIIKLAIENGIQLRELFSKLNSISNDIKYENNPKTIVEGRLITSC